LKNCVAVICQELLKANAKLQSVVPARIGFDFDKPFCWRASTMGSYSINP
jgi:hypothetical protein